MAFRLDKVCIFRGSLHERVEIYDDGVLITDDISDCDFAIFLDNSERKLAAHHSKRELAPHIEDGRINFSKSYFIAGSNGIKSIIQRAVVMFIKFICLLCPVSSNERFPLVVVCMGMMGDYILLRNSLMELKNRYSRVCLVIKGPSLELAKLDFDDVYPIYLNIRHPLRMILCLARIRGSIACQTLFNVMYSRDIFCDMVSMCIKADRKYALVGDYSNIGANDKRLGDKVYDGLFESSGDVLYEFDRNVESISSFLGERVFVNLSMLDCVDPTSVKFTSQLSRARLHPKSGVESGFVAICVDASSRSRIYPNFERIISFCLDNYDFKVLLLGSDSDLLYPDHPRIINLIGKTTVSDLIGIIHASNLLIANDTGVVHMANALGKHSIVLSNGFHFERFSLDEPRDNYLSYSVYPPGFLDRRNANKILCNLGGFDIGHVVGDIDFADIERSIDSVLRVT